ncbi:MAG TPA: phytanoyl-CoA dioxygenase family protein, partial [Burkholderiaceae bacterium]|nr:phytanoyl-CoA dioxygenase family protein [Burkholderiaceae bacterium]
MSVITAQQVEQYRRDGYCIVENIADATTLARMKAVLADLVERSRAVRAHDDIYDLEPGHSSSAPRVRRIKKPTNVDRVFAELVRSPAMTAVLRALLGPAARLHGSKLNLKSPEFGSPVEWHQDWAFYPHTNDDVLAIGVMLEDIDLDNGPMLIVPGSHRGPTYDHHADAGYFCGAIDPAKAVGVDFASAVPVVGKAGAASFHHVRAVHGSGQNTSTRPRPFLLYEVTAADAFPLMGVSDWGDFHGRMLY